jgi:hypothetical protein
MWFRWARVLFVLALSAASLLWPLLALLAALLVLVTFLSVPRDVPERARLVALLAASAILAVVASIRFVVTRAVPGLVQGGTNATEQRALSRLREVLFAEDAMRRLALHDPDRDGVGSAGLIGELSGVTPVRGARLLDRAPLNSEYSRLVDTEIGPAAAIGAYLFVVCLPTRRGEWSARPGDEFDDERAERAWVGYAWPIDDARGVAQVFFLDQHERILTLENRKGRELSYAGPNFPPPCDVGLGAGAGSAWKPWRNKQPRAELPGDKR